MSIRLQQLRKIYRVGVERIHALRGLDLIIEDNEFVAVMGSSGSGKSTLMNILGCLDRESALVILLDRDDHGSLLIEGKAALAGTLQVRVDSTFKAKPGKTITILKAGKITGAFKNPLKQIVANDGTRFKIRHTKNSVTLTAQ